MSRGIGFSTCRGSTMLKLLTRIALICLTAVASTSVADDSPANSHELIRTGSFSEIKALLGKEPRLVRVQDKMDRTPLHIAAQCGRANVVDLLIKAGADVNAKAYSNFTPLHFARDPRVIKVLADRKADLEATASGITPLEFAAVYAGEKWDDPKYPRRDTIRTLRDVGAKYTPKAAVGLGDKDHLRELFGNESAERKFYSLAAEIDDFRGKIESRLWEASRDGHADVVKFFMDLKVSPVDSGAQGYPLLHLAIKHPAVVKILLEAGAPAKGRIEDMGRQGSVSMTGPGLTPGITLLHDAAWNGPIETAKLLIEHGAEVNAEAENRSTPVQWAATHGRLDMVRLLLKHGADLKGERGEVAMRYTAYQIRPSEQFPGDNNRRREMILFLNKQGVPIDMPAAIAMGQNDRVAELLREKPSLANESSPPSRPLLHQAIMLNQLKIVELMLDAGAKLEMTDEHGATPLVASAFWGREEITKSLLKHGAKINAKDKNGATALHEAARCAHPADVKLLLDAGADPMAKDDRGRTPLDWIEFMISTEKGNKDGVRPDSKKTLELLRRFGKKM